MTFFSTYTRESRGWYIMKQPSKFLGNNSLLLLRCCDKSDLKIVDYISEFTIECLLLVDILTVVKVYYKSIVIKVDGVAK